MAIYFANGIFVRDEGRLVYCGESHTTIARIDDEITDKIFDDFRGDLSVIESNNGRLTIVPNYKDKDMDADTVWLFVPLCLVGTGVTLERNAFLVAPSRQGIDCRASKRARDFSCAWFDIVVVKAKDGDRYCHLRSWRRPQFIDIRNERNGGPVCTHGATRNSFDGMFVFPHCFCNSEGIIGQEVCASAFYVAHCAYYGLGARKIGYTQPDSAGIAVI